METDKSLYTKEWLPSFLQAVILRRRAEHLREQIAKRALPLALECRSAGKRSKFYFGRKRLGRSANDIERQVEQLNELCLLHNFRARGVVDLEKGFKKARALVRTGQDLIATDQRHRQELERLNQEIATLGLEIIGHLKGSAEKEAVRIREEAMRNLHFACEENELGKVEGRLRHVKGCVDRISSLCNRQKSLDSRVLGIVEKLNHIDVASLGNDKEAGERLSLAQKMCDSAQRALLRGELTVADSHARQAELHVDVVASFVDSSRKRANDELKGWAEYFRDDFEPCSEEEHQFKEKVVTLSDQGDNIDPYKWSELKYAIGKFIDERARRTRANNSKSFPQPEFGLPWNSWSNEQLIAHAQFCAELFKKCMRRRRRVGPSRVAAVKLAAKSVDEAR